MIKFTSPLTGKTQDFSPEQAVKFSTALANEVANCNATIRAQVATRAPQASIDAMRARLQKFAATKAAFDAAMA